jgi:CHASE2 domain-containing sensor protein
MERSPPSCRARSLTEHQLNTRRFISLLSIGVLAAGTGLAAAGFHGLDAVRSSSVDARCAVRGAQGPGDDVVLVGIDDSSLAHRAGRSRARCTHACSGGWPARVRD